MKKLTFEDLERIHNALMQVEKVVYDINSDLIESRNYSDLQVISKLKIKLDEAENIIVEAGKMKMK